MKSIFLILLLTTGETITIPETLQIGEFCSDKIDKHTKFIKNPNYYEGSGEVWIHRYYYTNNDHDEIRYIVSTHWCESIDRKYYVSYNDGKS